MSRKRARREMTTSMTARRKEEGEAEMSHESKLD